MAFFLQFLSIWLFSLVSPGNAQSTGWRMTDRFYGFRFEILGSKILDIGFETALQQKADDLGCFGWVQESGSKSLVGEARCPKSNGPKLEKWLEAGYSAAAVDKVVVKNYEDTKIRLHFAYFKILAKSRDTCFLDPPHMCPVVAEKEYTQASSDEL
jgi:acylphosphatase